MNSGIYEIVNTANGHRYIGSAVNIPRRWRQHKSDLTNNKHGNGHLQNAWNKYGADSFSFRVLEYCFFFLLIPREQYYIETLKPEYNIVSIAGSQLGFKHSDETKARLSAANRGKKLTLETIAKMSAARTGEKRTPEARARMSAWQRGKKLTPEHIAKMTGRKLTPETRAKISAAQIGKKLTPEHKAKLSAALMGKKKPPRTPEARANMSAAQKRRFQGEVNP